MARVTAASLLAVTHKLTPPRMILAVFKGNKKALPYNIFLRKVDHYINLAKRDSLINSVRIYRPRPITDYVKTRKGVCEPVCSPFKRGKFPCFFNIFFNSKV